MPTATSHWKSLRVKPSTHRKFKELAARRGGSIDDVADALADAGLRDPAASVKLVQRQADSSHRTPAVIDEIISVARECRHPNWDGYEAVPVARATKTFALRFAKTLPESLPAPTIGAEPDGSLTFEWHHSARRTLSVSLGRDGDLHYAALLGPRKRYGTEPFSTKVPAPILDLIRQVESSFRAGAA